MVHKHFVLKGGKKSRVYYESYKKGSQIKGYLGRSYFFNWKWAILVIFVFLILGGFFLYMGLTGRTIEDQSAENLNAAGEKEGNLESSVPSEGSSSQTTSSEPSGSSESSGSSAPSEANTLNEGTSAGVAPQTEPTSEPTSGPASEPEQPSQEQLTKSTGNETLPLNPETPQEVNETQEPQTTQNETQIAPANETLTNETLLNQTTINETLTNETLKNETFVNVTYLRLIKQVPNIKIAENSSKSILLSDYFVGAESYELNASNISWSVKQDEMVLKPEDGFKGVLKAVIIAYAGNESIQSNEFSIIVFSEGVTIATYHEKIIVGEPVRWIKNISFIEIKNISIELPFNAKNISIKKIKNEAEEVVEPKLGGFTGSVISSYPKENLAYKVLKGLQRFIINLFRSLTGRAIFEEVSFESGEVVLTNITEANKEVILVSLTPSTKNYVIEYYTEPATKSEVEFEDWKLVEVSAPNLNYKDVIVSTNISENISSLGKIKVYWRNYEGKLKDNLKRVKEVENISLDSEVVLDDESKEELTEEPNTNNEYVLQEIPFDSYDLDQNGTIDYLEWVAPHLSKQAFEIRAINETFSGLNYTLCNLNNFCIYIRNSSGSNKAIFDKYGNVDLVGRVFVRDTEVPGNKSSLVFKNKSGSVVAWVSAITGDLHLSGNLIQQQGVSCNPSGNSFVIKNSSGSCVLYINSSGDMWAKGIVNENALI